MLIINWCWKGAERLCPCCRISWYPKQTMRAGFVAQSVACWGNVFPPHSQTCRALWFNRPCGTHTGTSDSLFSLSLFSCFFPHLFAFSAPLNIHSICLTLSPFLLLHSCSLSRCLWLWQALKIKPLRGFDYIKCFALQFQSAFDYWKVQQCIDFEGRVFKWS